METSKLKASPSKLLDPLIKRKNFKLISSKEIPFSTTYNFYRKSIQIPLNNDELSEQKESVNFYQKMNNLKLEISKVHDKVLEHCDIIPYYKNPRSEKLYEKLAKKIKAIEMSKDEIIPELLNQITSKSFILNQMMSEYNCNDQNELIQMLYCESKFSEIYLNKLIDLYVLFSLKSDNQDSSFQLSYQNKHITWSNIIELIENLSKKQTEPKKKNGNVLQINKCEIFEIVNTKDMGQSSFMFDASNRLDLTEFANDKEIEDISPKSEYNLIETIMNHTSQSNNNLKVTFERTRTKSPTPTPSHHEDLDNFMSNNNVKEENKVYDHIQDEIKEKDETINHLRRCVEKYNKSMISIKSHDEKRRNQLLDQVKDLGRKSDRFEERLRTCKDELDVYKNLVLKFENQAKKSQLVEYELVLKDELECLKAAFVKRIEEITNNYADSKNEMKKKLVLIEYELNQNIQMKEYFMEQVHKSK